jgi:hypothetical protein
MSDIREALLQVAESDKDPLTSSVAKSLAEHELGGFEFIVSIVIRYEILSYINAVSKQLQSKDMIIDIAIESVQGLIFFSLSIEILAFQRHWKLLKELQWSWILIQAFAPSVKLQEKDSLIRDRLMHMNHILQRSHLGSIIFCVLLIKLLLHLKPDLNNTKSMKKLLVSCLLLIDCGPWMM